MSNGIDRPAGGRGAGRDRRRSAAARGREASADALKAVRVAVYVRISTDEEHQPFSKDAQRHRLASFIASQPGWVYAATYEDKVSGAKASRPDLDRALRDAALGKFDVFLVYRVDRAARSLRVLVDLLEQLESLGVAFRSAAEPIDTSTATGRMLVQLLGVFAEFERATIIDRVVNGMERKAARGGWPGGPLPYGLALDEDKRLAVQQPQFFLIQRIFGRYAEGSVGAIAIAAELNDDGHRTGTAGCGAPRPCSTSCATGRTWARSTSAAPGTRARTSPSSTRRCSTRCRRSSTSGARATTGASLRADRRTC
jgi:site-specific DNA recombinase